MKKNLSKKKSQVTVWRFIKDDKFFITLLSVCGTLFNVGLVFIPIFEGWLAQCLYDIIKGEKVANDMFKLVAYYMFAMLFVQLMRYLKRFYVRRVSNRISVRLRKSFYSKMLDDHVSGNGGSVGEAVTHAVSDIEAVSEGIRKTITEIFDTGVLLISYSVTMIILSYQLAIISLLFMPIACLIAELLKKIIYAEVSDYKKSAERLNNATFERVNCALLFRVHGRDKAKNDDYCKNVADFEKKAVRANVWENTLQPIYNIIAMLGIVLVIYLGGKNVLGVGFIAWNIASFTTFISCYTKLADKSSKVAKLFNSVQRAKVSWGRLKNNLTAEEKLEEKLSPTCDLPVEVEVNRMCVSFDGKNNVINNASFTAKSGEIIGITGAVACGKTTLGKAFLKEFPYSGSIKINGKELKDMSDLELFQSVTYLGHSPELFSASIRENILMGDDFDAERFASIVKIDEEISEMEEGIDSTVGNSGIRLSGGQQARVALARTLAHAKSILILDDPFSAVDKKTEAEILNSINADFGNRLIIIISHRLTAFKNFSKVLWIDNGEVLESTHSILMQQVPEYARLNELQAEALNG